MQGMLLSCLEISDWHLEYDETIIVGGSHPKIPHVMKDMRKDLKVISIIFLVKNSNIMLHQKPYGFQ